MSSLSARLLVLTILFVMVAEVLIFVPSIANFREDWLKERLASAQLAALALEATPNDDLTADLEKELLTNAGVRAVIFKREETRTLILQEAMPPEVGETFDLREQTAFTLLADALELLAGGPDGVIQVIDTPRHSRGKSVAILIDEEPLFQAMTVYGRNVFLLSVLISVITAVLIYISLYRLLVRPLQTIQGNMIAFSENPEDANRIIQASTRRDEIGTVERELHAMQEEVHQALKQKARLANLGEAVSKINHDLRNILSSAQLVSDSLSRSRDPRVKKVLPMLVRAIDRAIDLCTETLKYGRAPESRPRRTVFHLSPLVDEVGLAVGLGKHPNIRFENRVPTDFDLLADPDQLFRVLQNLVRNAAEALGEQEGQIDIWADYRGNDALIEVRDTGPGIPQAARANLFKPFKGSARTGGTGLGLANARELVEAHEGEMVLVKSDDRGTIFCISLPHKMDVAAQ